MIYKGKEIEDHCYVGKNQMIESLDENSMSITLENIESWKELIIKKTEELKFKGVDFKNVTIGIIGDGYHYNPNGADNEPYMNIYLVWQESETDEERERRIGLKKKWIDEDIECEKRREEAKKLVEQKEIERSVETLRNAGYQVTKS